MVARNRLALLVLLATTTVLVISRLHYPPDAPLTTLCGLKTALGLSCPGCGLTRAFCAMAKFELMRAFHFNLLGPPLFLLTVATWMAALLACLGRDGLLAWGAKIIFHVKFVRAGLALLAVYWLARIGYEVATLGAAGTLGRSSLASLLN